jgi:dTDP-4-amino-4,6-dideoxygalactose transaminase
VSVEGVPLLDLCRLDADLQSELVETFSRVLASGHYILGPEVDAFEAECARYIGVRHAIGVSSGTDALLLALMALGIGPGDEVICPTLTFFATAGSIWRTGARPVFVDSSLVDYNCDTEEMASRISARTKAIMPVHLFGRCADMVGLRGLAGAVPIIEDAAQAIGATSSGQGAGTFGSYGCFSFFPSKNLGGFGDAGLVTTNDDTLAEKARVLRAHGGKPRYYHQVVGGNFRIDALQAALLRPKLRRLDGWTRKRQENAAAYAGLLSATGLAAGSDSESVDSPIVYPASGDGRHVFNQFCIRVAAGRRDALRAWLSKYGVGTEVYYPLPLHLQQCFASLGAKPGEFPRAERAAAETIALPIFPQLRLEEIEYVVDCIRRFFGG